MVGERPLLILYGSQTGCAQEVAERIGWEGRRRHFNVRVAGMDEYDVLGLPCEPLVVLCASTTGQGDAPDNMRAFWAFLLRRSLGADSLSGTTFAVFGLGDSGYAKYNAVAKRLDRRLEMLGAARLVPLGLGDDQARAGYDQALDPWLSALWDAALGLMPLPAGAVIDTSDTLPPSRYCVTPLPRDAPLSAHAPALPHAPEMPSARRPFMARIVEDQLLTAPGIDREVRHFELDLAGSGLAYQPGDIVAVQPRNAPALVRAFAQLCGLDLDARVLLAANPLAAAAGEVVPEPVCGWGTVTVRDILERHMDFMATPRRRFFEVLRHFCPEPLLQERIAELASTEGRADLYDYCLKVGRSGMEVLRDFPAARPPLEYLMEALGAVRPRLFSISSGPSAFGGGGGEAPRRLSITVAIVEYQSKTRMQRQGLCTSFLKVSAGGGREDGGDEGGRVPIWVRDGSLRVPKKKERDEELGDLAVPLILVGPGTGLAPLRAFLQERAHVRQRLLSRGKEGVARDLLFFGCRKREEDYLYQAALEGWLASGDLAHLGVAFSRESPAKVYVQHKIREAAAAVWAALEAGGVIMVSGASEKMPQDVREAFVSVVEGQAGQDREFAEAYVKRLEAQRRYLQDTWG